MRFVLALLAVMAMLAGAPLAMAVPAPCMQSDRAVAAGRDAPTMGSMSDMGAHKVASDPCGHPNLNDKGCAQFCAASCAVTATLPASPASVVFFYARTALIPVSRVSVQAHTPDGLERPPKSIV